MRCCNMPAGCAAAHDHQIILHQKSGAHEGRNGLVGKVYLLARETYGGAIAPIDMGVITFQMQKQAIKAFLLRSKAVMRGAKHIMQPLPGQLLLLAHITRQVLIRLDPTAWIE